MEKIFKIIYSFNFNEFTQKQYFIIVGTGYRLVAWRNW